ncbi:ComF family protein [Buchananella hordeovulneris]|uniref:Phosphoribosyltransferase domain-containing protein n=1 Tax=Buchananella hordeovulneris TaxID=52770 RepID=A0A1Q5PW84_9ACTO|nr:phosphoribosyltransferase family protein [Buchananella hordeovulneris]OKL51827.1 hypothetical protein BSZ40_04890 [Buchananella hordeovulneris]
MLLPSSWRALGAAAWDLLAPHCCAGCAQPGHRWCQSCRADFATLRLVETMPVPIWALSTYRDGARRVVLAYKARRRPDLDEPLAALLRGVGRQLAPRLAPGGHLQVIPAPSGWQRRWRRALVATRLAEAFAAGARAATVSATTRQVLARRGAGGNLHHLTARQRSRRRRGHLYVRRPPASDAPVVLIDDVLTTGATLSAASAALTAVGCHVVGAVVLAATARPAPELPDD